MPLISEEYRRLQRELHGWKDYGKGVDTDRVVSAIELLSAGRIFPFRILDYGAGSRSHLMTHRALLRHQVFEYDPAVERISSCPDEHFEVVVAADVLEHIEPDCLDDVLRHIRGLAVDYVIFAIATRPSGKVMADGRNAHLIVWPPDTWRERLAQHFIEGFSADHDHAGRGLFYVGRPGP